MNMLQYFAHLMVLNSIKNVCEVCSIFCATANGILCRDLFRVTDLLDVLYETSLDEVFWLVVSDLRFRVGRIDRCSMEKAG